MDPTFDPILNGPTPPGGATTDSREMVSARRGMVDLIRRRGITHPRILAAMGTVPRECFFPDGCGNPREAYGDHPNPIGWKQTISQPYIVAYMLERLAPQSGEKALEIGTGSGYQTALLATLDLQVFSIERIPDLAEHASRTLAAMGYQNIRLRRGDGYAGWPEHAPFDMIIVGCAAESPPTELMAQLAPGGRMLIPLGVSSQRLVMFHRTPGGIARDDDLPVRFVPMVAD